MCLPRQLPTYLVLLEIWHWLIESISLVVSLWNSNLVVSLNWPHSIVTVKTSGSENGVSGDLLFVCLMFCDPPCSKKLCASAVLYWKCCAYYAHWISCCKRSPILQMYQLFTENGLSTSNTNFLFYYIFNDLGKVKCLHIFVAANEINKYEKDDLIVRIFMDLPALIILCYI